MCTNLSIPTTPLRKSKPPLILAASDVLYQNSTDKDVLVGVMSYTFTDIIILS